jgi:hypothetical protein
VTAGDLQDWISSTEHYDPSTHWVGALIVDKLRNSSLLAPLTTSASEARSHFSNAMRVRPLALDIVRHAARVYHDELVATGYTASEMDARGREEMMAFRYAFTHFDDTPLLGLHVAAAIAEGFHINWRLVKDEGQPDPR